MIRVVIDTNVIISSLLTPYGNPALIISSVIQEKIKLCLSDEIFGEYKGVSAYQKFKHLDQDAVNDLLNQLEQKAMWFTPKVQVNIIKDDPADNKFLECALESNADFFITGNTKHFSFEKFHNTCIVKPTRFMHLMAEKLFD